MKFKENEKAKVIACNHGHQFKINSIISIIGCCDDSNPPDYYAENEESEKWWVTDDELEKIETK